MIRYFDLGCAEGETVESFLAGRIMLPDLAKDCAFVAGFDAFGYKAEWDAIAARHPQVTFDFRERAVGVPKGTQVELMLTKHPWANTLVKENFNFSGVESVELAKKKAIGFDFPKYLKTLTQPGDVNIVKLDIEGSEYDLLDAMIGEGAMLLVHHLFVEFHGWIMPPEYAERERSIRERCPIAIGGWG